VRSLYLRILLKIQNIGKVVNSKYATRKLAGITAQPFENSYLKFTLKQFIFQNEKFFLCQQREVLSDLYL